jgi:hypothetical protein
MKANKPTYTIVVQPEKSGAAGDRQLRELLKRLLRSLRMRCVSIKEEKP